MTEANIIQGLIGLLATVNFLAWKRVLDRQDLQARQINAISVSIAKCGGGCK